MFNGTSHNNFFNKLSTIELGRRKDIIAVTDERDVAEAVADGVRDAIVDNGHVQSGVDYAKYVNGRDIEAGLGGFINEGIQQAQREYPQDYIQPIIQTT